MTRLVRVVVADDEPPARERVTQLLSGVDGIQVVAECAHGEAAVGAVRKLSPDLLFLDIQMPRLDGFEVVAALQPDRMPPVIFVTAYDRYALKAFDVHAVDYLLKPYSKERFQEALARALREVQLRKSGLSRNLEALVNQLRADGRLEDRIVVQTGRRMDMVKVTDIDWIEAAGNYVVLHSGGSKHLLRETMVGMGRRLSRFGFVRTHRSFWVNVERIDHLRKLESGDFEVHLKGGGMLPGSRRFAPPAWPHWKS